MTETEQAIEHFEYGISHDIFSEPVTTYARLAVAALRDHIDREKPHSLKSNDYPKEGQRVLFWDTLNSRWATGHYSCPHWEADDCRVEASHWISLPEPPKGATL